MTGQRWQTFGRLLRPGRRLNWLRMGRYRWLRVLRIPDSPQRIARGVFMGTIVAFSPLFGLHFVIAPVLAWMIGGSILASIAAVFVCNPFTFPAIAYASFSLGSALTGDNLSLTEDSAVAMTVSGLKEIWLNLVALFTTDTANWDSVSEVVRNVFVPYLIGGAVLGLVSGAVLGWMSYRLIAAYQRRRRRAVRRRSRKRGAG